MENIHVTHTEFMQDGMKCERTDAFYLVDGKHYYARLPWLASAQEVRFHIIRQRQGYSNK